MIRNPQPSMEGQTMTLEEALSVLNDLVSEDTVGMREAVAMDTVSAAIHKLSSPDYIVVPRTQAEEALTMAWNAGRLWELRTSDDPDRVARSRAADKKARQLLTLEEE